jgi:hypothetical protein
VYLVHKLINFAFLVTGTDCEETQGSLFYLKLSMESVKKIGITLLSTNNYTGELGVSGSLELQDW